ncbi:hypothetical protein TWF694_008214 [Orbilia ellipsospora]|uniref:EGF domain-specific O-linked N-acetylglucosamine transferase n=1 Tax=Orbilia ellipsospora TaxID=2528407 RepID=A0AAV9XFU6_9PEZI
MLLLRPRSFSPATLAVAVLIILSLYFFSYRFGPDSSSLRQELADSIQKNLQEIEGNKKPQDAVEVPPLPPTEEEAVIPTPPSSFVPTTLQRIQIPPPSTPTDDIKSTPTPPSYELSPLPSDYHLDPHETSEDKKWCETRYGPTYLETIAKNARPYCTPESTSQFDCMHSVMLGENRLDSTCLAHNIAFDENKFNIDCQLRDWATEPDLKGIPRYNTLPDYWYTTGPRNIITQFVNFGPSGAPAIERNACNDPSTPRDDGYKVLIKREGGINYWHSLMEIFSFYFTIDALQMAINQKTGKPYMSPEDLAKIQVIILDKHDNKNYFELWNFFAVDNPVLTLPEFAAKDTTKKCISNIILPLPGGSNPLWQGDWDPRNCDQSLIVETLRTRVLNHLHVPQSRDLKAPLNLTFIDRKGTRKLRDTADLTDALKKEYPDVNINVVDMAKLSLREQLAIIVQTDVLVGVHGAGHTHGFFLPKQSSVVEILPPDLKHKGFRNLAALRGLRYFSDHGQFAPKEKAPGSGGRDWHEEDIVVEKAAFMKLVDAAVQSVRHRGFLDKDVS